MAREWVIQEFDPKTDHMLDCSSVEVPDDDYDPNADADNVTDEVSS